MIAREDARGGRMGVAQPKRLLEKLRQVQKCMQRLIGQIFGSMI